MFLPAAVWLFSRTPMGAELAPWITKAFPFNSVVSSRCFLKHENASTQSLEVLFVRDRNDFSAGSNQCGWGPLSCIHLLQGSVLHTFKQACIRWDLTNWVGASPPSSALMQLRCDMLRWSRSWFCRSFGTGDFYVYVNSSGTPECPSPRIREWLVSTCLHWGRGTSDRATVIMLKAPRVDFCSPR